MCSKRGSLQHCSDGTTHMLSRGRVIRDAVLYRLHAAPREGISPCASGSVISEIKEAAYTAPQTTPSAVF